MVLRTTRKRHMIPAPPAVSSVPNTDAPQSRHHILRKQQYGAPQFHNVVPPVVPPLYPKYGVIHMNAFKPLGRPCIPFHSIPQTANAGVCWLPGVQWNGKESSIHLPYFTIFPPSASLDSMWRIDRGSKSDRL
ncbi:hypothetical protein XELAEV_18029280mg [Xenopus laevis]|uniref:Uncharacterized protein n=1 Tax=Xenopus laevis TaxID=8355 RepID=A0A974CR74_XENLA|nr:hypothetical protein XELAEV_18029280mg [Xenopus laevis]